MPYLKRFISHKNLGTFHRAVLRTVFVQGTMMVLSLLTSILLSRSLGTAGRGVVSWMVAYAGFGSVIILIGAGPAARKYIAKMPGHASSFVALGFTAMLLGSFVLLPFFYHYGISKPIAHDNPVVFALALCIIPCVAASSLMNDLLIGLGRSLHSNILFVVEKGMGIALSAWVLVFGHPVPLIVVAIYFSAVCCRLSVNLSFMRPYLKHLPTRDEMMDVFSVMRKLMFSSYFSTLAIYYTGNLLLLVLGVAASASELGYFTVAKSLIDAGIVLPTTVAVYALPHLAMETTQESHEKSKRHIIWLTAGAMIIIAIPPFFFSRFIIHLLFGSAFMPAAECLRVMSLGMAAYGVILVAQSVIASYRHELLLLVSSGGLALCMTALTLFFHSYMSAVVAAYIYSAAYVLGMVISLIVMLCARW